MTDTMQLDTASTVTDDITQPDRSATSSVEIIKPGMLSLLQDAGRKGYLQYGVSHSGVVDTYAAAWANRLVGNTRETPLIEVTLGGLQLRAHHEAWCSVTGADLTVYCDGRKQSTWTRFKVNSGEVISLGFASRGQRAYVAISGGFDVEPILGSVATHQRNGLGGIEGKGTALAAGDHIPFNTSSKSGSSPVFQKGISASAHWQYIPDYNRSPILRFNPGCDWRKLNAKQQERFLSNEWEVTSQSDRMGIRLHHDSPITEVPKRAFSLGITPGAIQLPPSGEPLILMADSQTMGGYPLLGWVHPLDLARLSQVPSKRKVRFHLADIDSIQSDLRHFDDFFAVLP